MKLLYCMAMQFWGRKKSVKTQPKEGHYQCFFTPILMFCVVPMGVTLQWDWFFVIFKNMTLSKTLISRDYNDFIILIVTSYDLFYCSDKTKTICTLISYYLFYKINITIIHHKTCWPIVTIIVILIKTYILYLWVRYIYKVKVASILAIVVVLVQLLG